MTDSLLLTSDLNSLLILKLLNNGSNWLDYRPRVRKAMGAKGLWRHIEGVAVTPRQYSQVNSVYVLADGKTPASEEQVTAQEGKIEAFKNVNTLLNTSFSQQPHLVLAQRSKTWEPQRRCGRQLNLMQPWRVCSTLLMWRINLRACNATSHQIQKPTLLSFELILNSW